jgi:hypothetical protein
MELTENQRNNLDKLLKHSKNWIYRNDISQTNKILAVLTFFIALGEISSISKNIFENSTNAFYMISTLIILIVLIIFIIHGIKKAKHFKKMNKEGTDIIEGKAEFVLGAD